MNKIIYMKDYTQYITNIFRIDKTTYEYGSSPGDGSNSLFNTYGGLGEFTSLEGVKNYGDFYQKEEIFFSIGKYVQGKLWTGTSMTSASYFGKTEENEGVYEDGIIYESYIQDYVVGTMYYEKITEGEYKGANEYFLKIGNLVFSLGIRKWAGVYSIYHKIDDRELPMKVKLVGPINKGEMNCGINIITKIKDTVEELIKEILEEKGFNPTDEEINEIVKNSAFNPENEGKGILNPIYRTEGREVKKVKVDIKYLKPLGEGKREVSIENLD
ncbi:MAG: hypothetical protein Q8K30_06945 [Candidatus Gracilibacteria bacterium]|nr:hypothetical protein [Candidatus Gracilibacteria bacterium]